VEKLLPTYPKKKMIEVKPKEASANQLAKREASLGREGALSTKEGGRSRLAFQI